MNSAREVTLSGKAFFSVRKMHGRAFKVQSENLMVEVLGTSFLIDATKAESSSVYVKNGIVSVESENSKVIIKANQKAELDNNTLKTGKIENPYEVFEEKPKVLSFANAEIMEVVKKIEQATGVKIEVSKEISIPSDRNKLTDEVLFVRASSASVLQWFSYIEKQKGISISFNQSFDMERNCTVKQSATMSIAQLLDIILKDYRYSITEMPGRKIAIRIDAKGNSP